MGYCKTLSIACAFTFAFAWAPSAQASATIRVDAREPSPASTMQAPEAQAGSASAGASASADVPGSEPAGGPRTRVDASSDLPPRFEGPGSASRTREERATATSATKEPEAASGGAFEFPELVYGGNGVSVLMLNQFGMGSYLPRFRIGVQYDRQIDKAHWVHGGVAMLLDRGDYRRFSGVNGCRLETVADSNVCGPGTVMGVDIWLGYTYRFYLAKVHWLVPHLKGSVGWGYWRYPKIGGSRQQARESTWGLHVAAGGGVRIFLFAHLGIGVDLDLRIGSLTHTEVPLAGEAERTSQLQVGLQVLPLVGEYRF